MSEGTALIHTFEQDDLTDITLLVKTFERPDSLMRLMRSIRRFYPTIQVLIVDDSRCPLQIPGETILQMDFDSGISAGRNAGLKCVQTPFFVLLDDDYEFFEKTSIHKLVAPVRSGCYDIVCGAWEDKVLTDAPIVKRLEYDPPHEVRIVGRRVRHDDAAYIDCEIGHNFFAARTETIQGLGGWDPALKIKEHWDFFLRAKLAGLKCAVVPEVSVWHRKESNPLYRSFRQRKHIYSKLLNKKWNIRSSRWCKEQQAAADTAGKEPRGVGDDG